MTSAGGSGSPSMPGMLLPAVSRAPRGLVGRHAIVLSFLRPDSRAAFFSGAASCSRSTSGLAAKRCSQRIAKASRRRSEPRQTFSLRTTAADRRRDPALLEVGGHLRKSATDSRIAAFGCVSDVRITRHRPHAEVVDGSSRKVLASETTSTLLSGVSCWLIRSRCRNRDRSPRAPLGADLLIGRIEEQGCYGDGGVVGRWCGRRAADSVGLVDAYRPPPVAGAGVR